MLASLTASALAPQGARGQLAPGAGGLRRRGGVAPPRAQHERRAHRAARRRRVRGARRGRRITPRFDHVVIAAPIERTGIAFDNMTLPTARRATAASPSVARDAGRGERLAEALARFRRRRHQWRTPRGLQRQPHRAHLVAGLTGALGLELALAAEVTQPLGFGHLPVSDEHHVGDGRQALRWRQGPPRGRYHPSRPPASQPTTARPAQDVVLHEAGLIEFQRRRVDLVGDGATAIALLLGSAAAQQAFDMTRRRVGSDGRSASTVRTVGNPSRSARAASTWDAPRRQHSHACCARTRPPPAAARRRAAARCCCAISAAAPTQYADCLPFSSRSARSASAPSAAAVACRLRRRPFASCASRAATSWLSRRSAHTVIWTRRVARRSVASAVPVAPRCVCLGL